MYFNEEQRPGLRIYLMRTLWTGLVFSLAAVGLGLYAFFSPLGTLAFFVGAVGLFLTIHGVFHIVTAIIGIKSDHLWYTVLAGGLIQLLIGLFIVSRPAEISNTALMLSTVGIGMIGIAAGTINLIAGIRYRDAVRNILSFIIRGLLLFIIGVTMLLAPYGFGAATIKVVGIISLISGIFQLWSVIRLFKELRDAQYTGQHIHGV